MRIPCKHVCAVYGAKQKARSDRFQASYCNGVVKQLFKTTIMPVATSDTSSDGQTKPPVVVPPVGKPRKGNNVRMSRPLTLKANATAKGVQSADVLRSIQEHAIK